MDKFFMSTNNKLFDMIKVDGLNGLIFFFGTQLTHILLEKKEKRKHVFVLLVYVPKN